MGVLYNIFMLNHPPKNYECPICMSLKGIENDSIYLKQRDYVYKDKLVSAFISSSWIPTCEGHAIVVPNKHFENIYGLSEKYGHRIFDVAKKTAISIKKAYQ
jgi:histidine triad (HIT) family protein